MELPISLILLMFLSPCWSDQFEYLTSRDSPDPGPYLDSVYKPGTPGAEWTDEEIETTRYRILQAIHPDWDVSKAMHGDKGDVTENKILRLVFHDCTKYTG